MNVLVVRLPAASGIQGIAESVAEQVEGHDRDEDGQARNDHEHRVDRVEPVTHGVGQHSAPAWGGRDEADAQVVQRRLEQDVRGDEQRRVDQDRRDQVGQQLAEQNVRRAGTHTAGRVDEFALAQGQDLPAHDPAHIGPGEKADDENKQNDPEAVTGKAEGGIGDHADQGDGENQQRKSQEHVHGPGDDGVDPATEIAGDDAEEYPDDHGQGRGQETDQQRVAGAVDDPGQHVTAGDGLDTERVSQADPAERSIRTAESRVDQARMVNVRVLHQIRAEDGDQDEQDDDNATRHGNLVMLEPGPGYSAW